MPKSPDEMARRVKSLDELKQESRMQEVIEVSSIKDPRPRKNTRLYHLMEDIFDVYKVVMEGAFSDKGEEVPSYVPATMFADLTAPRTVSQYGVIVDHERSLVNRKFSRPSVVKARKLMGIRSLKIGNKWYWTFPRRAPTEAQDELYRKLLEVRHEALRTMKKQVIFTNRQSAQRVVEIMKQNNYDVPAQAVIEASGYNRQTVLRIKSMLGICSIKKGQVWHWVYPCKEVQEWICNLLADGPMILEDIFIEGRKVGYSAELLRTAKIACKDISFANLYNRAAWRLV